MFCESLANSDFFERHEFFRPMQLRRMGDVKYVASVVVTMIAGYFNRDELLEEYLQRYNDEFPIERDIEKRFNSSIQLIEKMDFERSSRVWNQADFFTLACELDDAIHNNKISINLKKTEEKLKMFYVNVTASSEVEHSEAAIYLRAAIQAANDRNNRIARGKIVRTKIS